MMAPRSEEFTDWQINYPEIRLRSAHLLRSNEWADCSFQFRSESQLQGGVPTMAGAGDSKSCLYAHKLILAMASPVFAAMFYGNVGDKESPVVIGDIDHLTFSALLSYIYTDEVDIPNTEAAIRLYKAANKYILVHLEKECLDFLFKALKNPNNVCYIYEFACFFGEKLLEEKCLEEFSTKTQLILKCSNFQYAESNTLKKIMSMDTLDINSEMDLFNALLEYANNKNFNKSDNSENLASETSKVEMDFGKSDLELCDEADNNNIARFSDSKSSYSSIKKPEDARRILKDIIGEIRFLSMTRVELAKIGASTTVLSKEEINALLSNKFYLSRTLPMPNGFSCVRKPRIRGAATVSHTFYNVATSMTIGKTMYSPPCYVRDLPWRIAARHEKLESDEFLGLYLECNVSQGWFCKAKVELRLLSFNPVTKKLQKRKLKRCEHTFCTKENGFGYDNFLKWSQLIDPDQGYDYIFGSITVEVHFATEPVQFF